MMFLILIRDIKYLFKMRFVGGLVKINIEISKIEIIF